MTEKERLAKAAAYGRQRAEETLALAAKGQAEHAQMMAMLRHQPPAPRGKSADLKEALLHFCQADALPPDSPSRPRLVLVKS